MGGDGGTTGNQRAYQRGCWTKEGTKYGGQGDDHGDLRDMRKAERHEIREATMKTCSISGEALRESVTVVCRLGYLYNKDAVITHLLDHKGEKYPHLRSIKDIVKCRFTENPAFRDDTKGGNNEQYLVLYRKGRYMCPITMMEFTGANNFCVIWPSGCVVSEKGLREMKCTECPVTGVPFTKEDVITIAPEDGRLQEMQASVAKLIAAENKKKAERKAAKAAARAASQEVVDGATSLSKKEGKRKRKKAIEEARATRVSSAIGATKLASAASKAIEKERGKSAVYSSIFKKSKASQGGYEDKKTLMMATAGFRGTLG